LVGTVEPVVVVGLDFEPELVAGVVAGVVAGTAVETGFPY
jgi:hypothetical protein